LKRAAAHRRMAKTARVIVYTIHCEAALLNIADRFDALADQRKQEQSRNAPTPSSDP
jgi:hypothetical protein